MISFSPEEIRSLRHRLGWSAREMGRVLDRSHATIYHWEGGETAPDSIVMAVLALLRDEFNRREREESKKELREWKERILHHGVVALLYNRDVEEHASSGRVAVNDLLKRAEQEGGLVIDSSDSSVGGYLVPFSKEGLIHFVGALTDESREENRLADLVAEFRDRVETNSPTLALNEEA